MVFPLLALALALALPGPAAASHTGDLWATVNICDTEGNPNVLGVRASMPGNGTKQTMWMRFRASYYDSGHREVVRRRRQQRLAVDQGRQRAVPQPAGGRKFRIDPPLPTTSHVVRGVGRLPLAPPRGDHPPRRTRRTLAGHPTGRHGDPRGYSAGLCEIAFP